MANVVVVGVQWGDEGKGKIVDILAENADVVVRFQGGGNAGHTLVVDGRKVVLHLVPSGVLHAGKRCLIGPGVVVDPEALLEEIAALKALGALADDSMLLLSRRAHVVTPYHKAIDAAREAGRGDKRIGTTLRGIGPCLEDKAARTGLRMVDLLDPQYLSERLAARLPEVNAVLAHYGKPPLQGAELERRLAEQGQKLAHYMGDTGEVVRQEMGRGRNVLFEGAQGALLDVDHGTYPFVTASSCVAGAASSTMGIGPQRLGGIVGVAKAYCTRVGGGPFPTEVFGELGERLRQAGGEFGATTGRPRRCGWLDLVALKQAVAMDGCTGLCLTKLDVLTGIDPIQVAVGYKLDGVSLDALPDDPRAVGRLEPVYEPCEGWKENIRDVREIEALPATTRKFIRRIESFVSVPVDIVSVGSARAETIMVKNPFRAH
ncbi:MAG: adenylosuccinate synthase [Myxococcales bacterium]|nr:adenylosuccinate synthase [Myxococcales bacterium]